MAVIAATRSLPLYMSQSSEVGDVSYVGTVRRIAVVFLHAQYPRAAGQHFVDYYTGNNTKYRNILVQYFNTNEGIVETF